MYNFFFRSITRSYYRNSAGAIIVYDVTNRSSFEHIKTWIKEAKTHVTPNKMSFALVGQKCDLVNNRKVYNYFVVIVLILEFFYRLTLLLV